MNCKRVEPHQTTVSAACELGLHYLLRSCLSECLGKIWTFSLLTVLVLKLSNFILLPVDVVLSFRVQLFKASLA